MSLHIKNIEAQELAGELARLTGKSVTKAVTEAIRERLEREKAARFLRRHRSNRALAAGRCC